MSAAVQIALTATPLAAYFYVLGVFHGGSRPRLVSGPADVGLMAFGLGGLVAFGPFGRSVLARLVGNEVGLLGWSIWVAMVVLWSLVLAGSATLRLSIYHLSPEELDRALREALSKVGGWFTPTIHGFEDAGRGTGITVKSLPKLRAGAIEAYGKDPEVLIAELKPRLQEALAKYPQRPSGISHAMFGLACLAMLVPVIGFFRSNPRAQNALRTLLESFGWW
jgi:hypothetical protein